MPTIALVRAARLSLLVTLLALVLMFVPGPGSTLAVYVVFLAAAAAGLLSCLALAMRSPRLVAVLGALACVGTVYPIIYLRSEPENSADIPLAQVGALFLSFVVMIAVVCLLSGSKSRQPARPVDVRH